MKTPQHIGIFRLSAMGDVAMVVPVLRVLLQSYPELQVTVVTKPLFATFFNTFPQVKVLEVDVYGTHKNLGLLTLAKQIKASGIDAFADLHQVIRSNVVRKYLTFHGIPMATIDKGRADKKELTRKDPLKKLRPLTTTHQRYATVFESLGFSIELTKHQAPATLPLKEVHQQLIGYQPKKIIGIAPYAAHTSKMYPLVQMQQVIKQLQDTKKYTIFLFGGGVEEEEKLAQMAIPFEDVKSVAGKLSFEDQLVLISNLDGMISMDSGNGHLAAMYGIPVLTLWGVTHPYAGFVPFGQPNEHQLISNREQYPLIPTSVYGNKFPEAYATCMSSIPVEQVVEKVVALF